MDVTYILVCGIVLTTAVLLWGRKNGWLLNKGIVESAQIISLLPSANEDSREGQAVRVPVSVNFHFLRTCNYKCGFCFHTATTSHILSFDKIKTGLTKLKEAGMKKINFAGGEPFLEPKLLGQMVEFCKSDLKLESVSIVSNGSKIREEWLQSYAQYVDIIAISCDSFDDDVNKKIGRGNGKHVQVLERVSDLLKKHEVIFKMNTVVNAYNWQEDMSSHITKLSPRRWKVFQVLSLNGENNGSNALRDVTPFLISKEQFDYFKERHRHIPSMVVEDNSTMRDSYLILDEYMRFLNCTNNSKQPSRSILDTTVNDALMWSGFDQEQFIQRDGVYDWSKTSSCASSDHSSIPDIEDLGRL